MNDLPHRESAELLFLPVLVAPGATWTLEAREPYRRVFRSEELTLEDFVEPGLWTIEDISVAGSRQLAVPELPCTTLREPLELRLDPAQSCAVLSIRVRNISDRPAVFAARMKGIAVGPRTERLAVWITVSCGCDEEGKVRVMCAGMELGGSYQIDPTCSACGKPRSVLSLRLSPDLHPPRNG